MELSVSMKLDNLIARWCILVALHMLVSILIEKKKTNFSISLHIEFVCDILSRTSDLYTFQESGQVKNPEKMIGKPIIIKYI